MPDGDIGLGPVVFVCSPAPFLNDDAIVPNWAYAFLTVLEKRGYTHTVILKHGRVDDDLKALHPGLVVVGPSAESRIDAQGLELLQSLDCPVFVEVAALTVGFEHEAQGGGDRFGESTPLLLDDLPISADAACQVFGQCPDTAACLDRTIHLPSTEIVCRYEHPDPRNFKNVADDSVETTLVKAALKMAFALAKRIDAADDGMPFPAIGVCEVAAVALLTMSHQLQSPEHRRYLRSRAERLLSNICEQGDAVSSILDRQADGTCSCTKEILLELPGRLRLADQVHRQSGHPDPESLTAPQLACSVISDLLIGNQSRARARLEWAVAERFDAAVMAFTNGPRTSDDAGSAGYSNHPFLLLAISLHDLPYDQALPTRLTPSVVGLNEVQFRAWSEPPRRELLRHAGETDIDQCYLRYAGSKQPAIWRQRDIVYSGIPLMAILGHAHSLPPLEEAFFGADSHRGLLLEEILFSIIESRLEFSDRITMKLAPWPDGQAPPLLLRHDVDRHPEPEQFDALMNLYGRSNRRASWYWISDRLDAERMTQLEQANHEIGLHAVSGADKDIELGVLRAQGAAVNGECYHGSGAEYHRGGTSVLAARQAQLLYSELHPCQYGFPYQSFPLPNRSGEIEFVSELTHITFTLTTDGVPGKSRKMSFTAYPELSAAARRLGHYTCVLNHPDINFAAFESIVKDFDDFEAPDMTAEEVAQWWGRSHILGTLSGAVDEGKLRIDVTRLDSRAAIVLLGKAVPEVVELDAGNAVREVRVEVGRDRKLVRIDPSRT